MKDETFDKERQAIGFFDDKNLQKAFGGDEKNLLNIDTKAMKEIFKIEQKNAENIKKISEKYKKTTKKEDKFAEKVIEKRKTIYEKGKKSEKNKSKIIKKCNDKIINSELKEKEIYLTIDKFNTNGKKTIVYFIDSFFPVIDGVVSVLDNYGKQMQKYYNVVICAPKHKQEIYKTEDYFVLQSNSMYIKNQGYDLAFPQFDTEFQKYINLLKIDLIHIHAPFNMGNFGLMLAKKRKVPCLISFHSQFKQNFYNAVKNDVIAQWLTKILLYNYKKADVVVTMNEFARDVLKSYGLKKPVKIIPNATNLKKKHIDSEFEEKILQKHKINKDIFNLIFIGRFVEVKNIYFIIDVMKEVFKINKNFNFIFLGYGPEQNKMQKLVKEAGMEDYFKFTGKIDDEEEKSIIIKNSDLLFFPSIYDTDGIVKIECACYDVPTLTIEGTGVASNIQNNHNGFVEKNDKVAFVNKIDFLIKNVDFVKKIGKNANLELYLTWGDVSEKLYNLYEETLKTYKLKNSKQDKNKSTKKVDWKF